MENGSHCAVVRFIGDGTQGEVYEAKLGNQSYAVKWLKPAFATASQRIRLDSLCRSGTPHPRFLWPIDMVTSERGGSFGYIMPLRDDRFRRLGDLLRRRVEPSLRCLITSALELVDAFASLHSTGRCYVDVSLNNIAFDPANGEVLVFDTDNVETSGNCHASLIGTPRFIAPELLRSEAAPSVETDLHSIAVLLFYMFFFHHPLHGKREADVPCLDEQALLRLEGESPLFIFDPKDLSNRPVRGYQDNPLLLWPIYPKSFKALFTRAFTFGLRNPAGRVRCKEWRQALLCLRDSLVTCKTCRAENFYEQHRVHLSPRPSLGPCRECRRELHLPPRLRIRNHHFLILEENTTLFAHHTDSQTAFSLSAQTGIVRKSIKNPKVLVVVNRSPNPWVVTNAHGSVREVPPGSLFPCIARARIHFGNQDAELRV